MRAHIVVDGVIVNTVVVERLADVPGCLDADAVGGSVGDLWDGETVTQAPVPAEPVPEFVTKRQARRALLSAGLLDVVESAIAAADRGVQIDWDMASEIRRDWPELESITSLIGLSSAQVDQLFIAAARITK